MSGSMASLNFDGAMRSDANHAGNPQYVPNSFVHKFRPDVAEAPYDVASPTVSRKSHYYHEGKLSEYTQATELYTRVMDSHARTHLHTNTADWLRRVTVTKIQVGYLAQLYCISPKYAMSVYELLPTKNFQFAEVEKASQGAEKIMKEPKFMPAAVDRLVGLVPPYAIYN